MPLVILGIIVVVGACLMIYYQIGPTLKARAGNAGAASSRSSSRDSFGGYIHVEVVPELPEDAEPDDIVIPPKAGISDEAGEEEKPFEKSNDGKVLYVFNGGKTELRPLNENPDYPDDDNVG
jgi:hypothetical protein